MKTFFLILSLVSTLAFAGDKGGNGGGGHACGDSVELYDFYEGRHPLLHNFKLWQQQDGVTMENYLDLALTRMAAVNPLLASFIKSRLDALMQVPQDQMILKISIPVIFDTDAPIVDEGCEYKQIANWHEGFKRIFISKSLFEKMNSLNRAGLFMHEIIYATSRSWKKVPNSNEVRRLTAKLFSDEVLTADDLQTVFFLGETYSI